jgi:hypothetical protein
MNEKIERMLNEMNSTAYGVKLGTLIGQLFEGEYGGFDERLDMMGKALSGDIAFKCTPATVSTKIASQNVGTQQAMVYTIGGAVASDGAGNIDVTVTAAGLNEGSKTVSVAVANSDNAAAIATAIKSALDLDADIGHSSTGMFSVTRSGADLTFTKKTEAVNDVTMKLEVETDTAVFETETPLSATAGSPTAGVAPYTRDVLVQLVDSEGNVHTWFNGTVPITIADNADGTASVETTDPVMVNGEMIIAVELQGTWVADKTNTLTASEKTILGYTVAAKTSVETSIA